MIDDAARVARCDRAENGANVCEEEVRSRAATTTCCSDDSACWDINSRGYAARNGWMPQYGDIVERGKIR